MNDFVIAILLIIGVATVLLLVRLLWYWMTGRLGNSQEQHTATIANTPRETFTSNYTTVLEKEHQLYEELNARHRATGEKCNDTMCGFPECQRCAGYKTAYCQYYSKDTEKVVKQKTKELSDSTIICLHTNRGGIRVFCCDYKTMPDDAIEQLLESDSYTEGYACIKDNSAYEQIKKDFSTYCNNTGMNNHYEEPGTYIDYTKHQEPTQCVSCDVFPWLICEWKGETSSIPRPRDYSSVKLSETQKRCCDSFDRDADRNADYWNKQGLR